MDYNNDEKDNDDNNDNNDENDNNEENDNNNDDYSDTLDSIPTEVQESLILASINLTKVNYWLKKKENIARAKRLLMLSDPFVSENRDVWLLICRACKVISCGNDDLLQSFIKWTKQTGEQGFIRSKKCRQAWNYQRPFTNCDHPVICKLRIYLQCKHDSLKETESYNAVLKSAEEYLKDRSIIFCKHDSSFSKKVTFDNIDEDYSNNNDRNTEQVLAAVYKYDTDLINDIDNHNIGSLDSTTNCAATITTGDVLYVKSTTSCYFYYRVISVDLIHARVRAIKCPPPPHSWFPHEKTEDAVWILVASLWNTTVFRQILPTEDDKNLKYFVFVTPLPSTQHAQTILSILPKLEKSKVSAIASSDIKAKTSVTGTAAPTKAISTKTLLKKPKINLSILRTFTHAAIVTWKLKSRKIIVNAKGKDLFEEEELHDLPVTVSISAVNSNANSETVWKEVYRGSARACQISGLEEMTSYHCRVSCSEPDIGIEKGKSVSSYVIISTIGNALEAPMVRQVSRGSAPGSVRVTVQLFENNRKLPQGCCYEVECLVEGSKKWSGCCRSNNSSMLCVGPWLGKSIFLRSRIINQDNQPGIESPQVYLQTDAYL